MRQAQALQRRHVAAFAAAAVQRELPGLLGPAEAALGAAPRAGALAVPARLAPKELGKAAAALRARILRTLAAEREPGGAALAEEAWTAAAKLILTR